MSDILHDFRVAAPLAEVFAAITSPAGLDAWWTKSSSGAPTPGTTYAFNFGPGYQWEAIVHSCVPDTEITWEFTRADDDWTGTRVRFELEEEGNWTQVRFAHLGWRDANQHYRTSCYCWAMYLRLLKRHVEHGEFVAYESRLDA